MESLERQPNLQLKNSLEQLESISDIRKVEISPEFFKWAEETLSPEIFQTIKLNYENIDAYNYMYQSNELSISGYIWAPKNITKPLPVAIWNRGGSMQMGSIGQRTGLIYANTPCDLVNEGMIVLASEYRGGLNSEGKDEWGGADVDDVIRIKEIADQLPVCRSGEAVVAGHSRGGMMSYILASKAPWVKALISISGTTDIAMSIAERPEMKEIWEQCFDVNTTEEIRKRSATYFYDKIPKNLPILIMHGTSDNRVSVEQSRKLVHLLEQTEHDVTYIEFVGAGHTPDSPGEPDRNIAIETIHGFLEKHSLVK